MLLPIPLLVAKDDNTPGDPIQVNQFVDAIRCFMTSSPDWSGSGIDLHLQIADSPSGPWLTIGSFGTFSANILLVEQPAGIGNTFVPFIRGILTGSPSAGSLSANVYMKQTIV